MAFVKSYLNSNPPKFFTFAQLPGLFRNRQKLVDNVQILFLSVLEGSEGEDWLRFEGIANGKYSVIIESKLVKDELTYNSPTKVLCHCDSFKYEFAYVLQKNQGLADEQIFYYEFMMTPAPPRKKNVQQVVTGCKHIIKFAQTILSRRIGKSQFRTDPVADPRIKLQMQLLQLRREAMSYRIKDPDKFQKLMLEVRKLAARLGM